MKKFQKTLILAFEIIVQPPENTFEITIFPPLLAHCGREQQELRSIIIARLRSHTLLLFKKRAGFPRKE